MFSLSHPLVLGSASPRRQQLLAALGFEFTVKTAHTNEDYPNELAVEQIAEYLANQKLTALSALTSKHIVLTADTVVVLENEALGKANSREEAIAMLQKQSGKTQVVYTGVAIGSPTYKISFSCSTQLQFKELSMAEINYYIDQYQPFDKAGSYGIQEWLGYIGIVQQTGSYTNVMGLPTDAVYAALQQFARDL
jgi:septum formation protein